MSDTTVSVNLKIDSKLKKEFDTIAKQIGLSSSAAINVFVRQFVAHQGFPFDVKLNQNDQEKDFVAEMDRRYEQMQKKL